MKKLDFSSVRLQGRSCELSILRDAYKKAAEHALFVLVHGQAGTGKSSLVSQLRTSIQEDVAKRRQSTQTFFVSGKFPQRTAEPYHALSAAFNELCDLIVASSHVEEALSAFKKDVGSKGSVLSNVVPNIKNLMSDMEQEDKSTRTETSFNQLKFVFQAFVRSVCAAQDHPVVLFIDDLQWADEASIKLVTSILNDSKLRNLLFIGSYRDNEIDETHPFRVHLEEMEKEHKEKLARIQLGNLDVPTVNNMISAITELSPSTTQPLTDIVYRKTNGNAFFVLQFLQMLQDEGLLFYSMTAFKWTWDTNRINSNTNLTENVVDIVAGKIQRMPIKVQDVVKLSAALWSTFDAGLLREIVVNGAETHASEEQCTLTASDDLVEMLDHAAEEGLLDKLDGTRYKFAHDRIQQAAYSLIPKGRERDELHHWIGTLLWQMSESPLCEEWMYFAAADQMNRGSNIVTDEEKRVDLAKLNLQAGEKAIAASAFVPASTYLKCGIEHLPRENRWEKHYNLSLKLHETLAETQHCTGDVQNTKLAVDEVLANAVCFEDKIKVYHTLCVSYFTQGKQGAAADLCSCVLRKLDEPLPKLVGKVAVNAWCIRLRRMLRGRSDADLLALPLMKDERKIASMKFCQLLHDCMTHRGKMDTATLVSIKMMVLSLKHGASELAGVAFSAWGECLVSRGDIQEGYRFGKLSLKLSQKFAPDFLQARIESFVSIFLDHWKEPLQQSLDPILRAHNTGLLNGDVMYAFQCILGYQTVYFYGGLPIQPGVEDLLSFAKQMVEYKQIMLHRVQVPLLQYMLNLMGRSPDVLQLTGEVMIQSEVESLETNPTQLGVQAVVSCRMQLAYYFGDIELAMELSKKLQRISKGASFSAHYLVCAREMFYGLVSLAASRKTGKRKYRAQALKIIKQMENKWVKRGAVNCLHKLLLLKAEYATLTNTQNSEIREAFDTAISTARRVGFVQDEALANERAGDFFLRQGDNFWASTYLSRSYELYREWGAMTKVQQLEEHHGSLLRQDPNETHSTNLRGRERFSDEAYKNHKTLPAGKLLA